MVDIEFTELQFIVSSLLTKQIALESIYKPLQLLNELI